MQAESKISRYAIEAAQNIPLTITAGCFQRLNSLIQTQKVIPLTAIPIKIATKRATILVLSIKTTPLSLQL